MAALLGQVASRLSGRDQVTALANIVPAGHASVSEEDLTCRQKMFLLLEEPDSSFPARVISWIIMGTIVASISCFILQTEPALTDFILLEIVEVGSLIIFFVEYVARFTVCNAFGDQTRCEFMKAPTNVIDLLAIFPTYLLDKLQGSFGNSEAAKPLRTLRAIRLVRVFRVFKLSKYSAGMGIMVQSVTHSTRPLAILVFILGIGVLFFSAFIYHAEQLSCPDRKKFSANELALYLTSCDASGTGWASNGFLCCDAYGSPNDFESITDSFWWTMVTMTTVGYGDKAPRTGFGRTIGCLAMISGIVLISLPVAIVGTKFQQGYELLEQTNLARAQGAPSTEALVFDQDAQDAEPQCDVGDCVFRTSRFLDASEKPGRPRAETDPGIGVGRSNSHRVPGAQQDESQYSDQSLLRAQEIRDKLRRLDGRRQLSRTAQGQVELMLEMLEHLDKADSRLVKLHEKDAALDVCINRDFVALSRVCGSVQAVAASS